MDVKLIITFAEAIQKKQLVLLTFYTKDYKPAVRKCVPLDMGPSRRAKKQNNKFHLWDLESSPKPHILSLDPEQVLKLEVLDEFFDPKEIITWDTAQSPWSIKRDWGILS